MRAFRAVLVLAALVICSGCSSHFYWLAITPEKQVPEGSDQDQDLRNRLSKLAKGPAVEGNSCTWFPVSSSVVDRTRQMAYADAISKAGTQYDMLADVMQTATSYPPFVFCVTLNGTAVKHETVYATTRIETTEKRKVKAR